jgi:hypothetical protein
MNLTESIKNWGPAARVRNNHALEHATLQILAEKKKVGRLAGFSDARGFWVIGEVDTEDLIGAVEEGIQRLNNGEHSLAIHPNCGTNLATAGLFGGAAAWLSTLNMGKTWGDRFDRLPLVITLVTMALIIAQPVGPRLQEKITTDPNLGDLRVMAVERYVELRPPAHRILTKG